jgi:hypothetical protein
MVKAAPFAKESIANLGDCRVSYHMDFIIFDAQHNLA